MTNETKNVKETEQSTSAAQEPPKKKRSFWDGFVKFLSMGGFILILILIVAIFIVISSAFNC